ncbi:MAG: cytochrome c oxidase subunit II [Actinomycetota bacterium]
MSRRVSLVAACAIALGSAACSGSFGMPRGASQQGRDTFDLWQVFFIAAIAVAALVYALIVWSLVRYRRRRADHPDELGSPLREKRGLEAVYVSIPLVMVVGLFALAFRTGERVDRVDPDPAVRVHVEAFAWGWRFVYPDLGVTVVSDPSGPGVDGPEMVLPLGETARIELVSNDVIHAFWVPDFLFKRDAIPGVTQEFDITPTETGTFQAACSEFCGLNHAYMRFAVKVVPPGEFASWAAQRAETSG